MTQRSSTLLVSESAWDFY